MDCMNLHFGMKKFFILIVFCFVAFSGQIHASGVLGDLAKETQVILNSLLASISDASIPNSTNDTKIANNTRTVANATSVNITNSNETVSIPVNNTADIKNINTTANSSELKCNSSTFKCVRHPNDIDDKDAFPTYNLSFLSDICQKTCLNSKNCIYMTTAQLEDLIRTQQLGNLQTDCSSSIPISIWRNVSSELMDLEFSKHQYILKSWIENPSSNIDLNSFVPKLVQLPRVRKVLFSSNLEGLDNSLCEYVQIKDFVNVSQLSDVSFNCMKIMLNDPKKCSAVPNEFFDLPSNVTSATWSSNLNTVMDHIRETITLDCFQSMNTKIQKLISQYIVSSGKLGSFNPEIVNYLKSLPQDPSTFNASSQLNTTIANTTTELSRPISPIKNSKSDSFVSEFDTSGGRSTGTHSLIYALSIIISFYSLVL